MQERKKSGQAIKRIGTYDIIHELGKGQFGQVMLAHKVGDPEDQYAVKVVKRSMLDSNKKILELFRTEVKIMKGLNHPNILKCYDFLDSGDNYYLVINLCKDGDLEEYINKQPNKRVDEKQAIFFLQQIMNGFKELGKNKIMHRDFKPANVFLNGDTVVIGDFGMSKIGVIVAKTHLGTPLTMAPEILFTDQNFKYTNKADLWSIGVTFYMLLFGNDGPFPAQDMEQLKDAIRKNSGSNVKFPDNVEITEETKDLIRSLLTIDPEERIEWSDFFGHSIFKRRESTENINKMVERKKTRYLTTYKEFDENTEYVQNNPDFKFTGKTPHELYGVKPDEETPPQLQKPDEEKSKCCAVF